MHFRRVGLETNCGPTNPKPEIVEDIVHRFPDQADLIPRLTD